MNPRALVNWRMFFGCLAVSFILAWAVNWFFAFSYWGAWGIIMFAWVGVGISTFFDDGDSKVANVNEKPKDSTGA